jgi:hypothetical protein
MNGKPASATVEPGSRPLNKESQEALFEAQELNIRRAELDRRNAARSNKVAQFLKANYYITDKAFPWLVYKGERLSVTEYYPEIRVAIDKYYEEADFKPEVCNAKRLIFHKHKIHYAFLKPGKQLVEIEKELEV